MAPKHCVPLPFTLSVRTLSVLPEIIWREVTERLGFVVCRALYKLLFERLKQRLEVFEGQSLNPFREFMECNDYKP